MPVRFTSPGLAGQTSTQLKKHQWQVDVAYRHLYADKWFVGTGTQGRCRAVPPPVVSEHSFRRSRRRVWCHGQVELGTDAAFHIRYTFALLSRSGASRGKLQRFGRYQRRRKLLASRSREGLRRKRGLRSRSKNAFRVEYRKTASLLGERAGPRPSSGPVDPVGRWRLGCDRASAGVSTDLSPVV